MPISVIQFVAKSVGMILISVVALIVGTAGVLKCVDLQSFAGTTDSWTVVPAIFRPLILSVPFLEILAAGLWLGLIHSRTGLVLLWTLLFVFTLMLIIQNASGKPPDCNCFSKLIAFRQLQQINESAVFRNIVLISMLLAGNLLVHLVKRPSHSEVRRTPSVSSPGFTIIELLVVIAIVAIVIALTLPSLGIVKRSSQRTASLGNLRQHVAVFAVYESDFRGMNPFITDPQATYSIVRNRTHGIILTNLEFFTASIVWHVAISDQYYEGDYAHRSFWPPEVSVSTGEPGRVPSPLPYLYSCTYFTRPEYWHPRLRTGRTQWGPTYAHELSFPSSKVMLGSPLNFLNPGTSPREALGFSDGSARAVLTDDLSTGYSTGDGVVPANQIVHRNGVPSWGHTISGIRGRDVQ